MSEHTQTKRTLEPLLTLSEAAEVLSVGRTTLWRLLKSGALPFIQVGAQARRIARKDLDDFIRANRSER